MGQMDSYIGDERMQGYSSSQILEAIISYQTTEEILTLKYPIESEIVTGKI